MFHVSFYRFSDKMWTLLLIKLSLFGYVRTANPSYYNIGGVLSSNESQAYFKDIISVNLVFI